MAPRDNNEKGVETCKHKEQQQFPSSNDVGNVINEASIVFRTTVLCGTSQHWFVIVPTAVQRAEFHIELSFIGREIVINDFLQISGSSSI